MSCPLWKFTKSNRESAGNGRSAIRGSVSAETIATLLLLLILGIGIFALAVSSTSAYSRVYEGKSLNSELRVALSFIHMKIRQNDLKDAIRIEENPVNGDPAIVIREEYEDEVYEIWIYQDDGKLWEALMPEGMAPSNELSFEIADVDGLTVKIDQSLLSISVWIDQNEEQLKLESSVMIRSG
jgi:hypothetical protein